MLLTSSGKYFTYYFIILIVFVIFAQVECVTDMWQNMKMKYICMFPFLFSVLTILFPIANRTVYVADSANNVLRQLDTSPDTRPLPNRLPRLPAEGAMTAFIQSIPESGRYPASTASMRAPQGVAMDTLGNIFVADTGHHIVRMIDLYKTWSVVAGSIGEAGSTGDGSAASSALLNSPWGIAVDSIGTLYIADTGNNAVRKVYNGTISTVLSNWTENGLSKNLNSPVAIATDTAGGLYIGDTLNYRIVKRGKIRQKISEMVIQTNEYI